MRSEDPELAGAFAAEPGAAPPSVRDHGIVAIEAHERAAGSRALATAALDHWPDASQELAAAVKDSVVAIRDCLDSELTEALLAFVETSPMAPAATASWSQMPLGVILRGLYSVARQATRSQAARSVLDRCAAVRDEVTDPAQLDGHQNELVAALMAVEDAVAAIEGYASLPPFAFVDEAYLSKYGLLQALQVGFDAAEHVARVLRVKLRADRMAGGKTVLVARNIVAGHPIGGSMAGQSWLHCHDRASAHDNSVIRVMSFSRKDPSKWTGQTLRTEELIHDGLDVIDELLTRALTAVTRGSGGPCRAR